MKRFLRDILFIVFGIGVITFAFAGPPYQAPQVPYNPAVPGDIGGTTPAAGTFVVLQGEVNVIDISGNTVLTFAQCKGSIINVLGAHTPVLPSVAGFDGSDGGNCLFIASTAAAYSVDVFASDLISLYGTDQSDGEKVTSPGTKGAAILFVNIDGTGWEGFRVEGNFTNGG